MRGASSSDAFGRTIDRSAICILAVAVAWALLLVLENEPDHFRWIIALVGAAGSCYAGTSLLQRLSGDQHLQLPYFEPAEWQFAETIEDSLDELVLEVLATPPDGEAGELLLEDPLEPVCDRSQVIRLFDPSQMPTAGELHERIDRHLATGPRALPDSTQELHAALSALRQTLR